MRKKMNEVAGIVAEPATTNSGKKVIRNNLEVLGKSYDSSHSTMQMMGGRHAGLAAGNDRNSDEKSEDDDDEEEPTSQPSESPSHRQKRSRSASVGEAPDTSPSPARSIHKNNPASPSLTGPVAQENQAYDAWTQQTGRGFSVGGSGDDDGDGGGGGASQPGQFARGRSSSAGCVFGGFAAIPEGREEESSERSSDGLEFDGEEEDMF